jgi:hypothetical protein
MNKIIILVSLFLSFSFLGQFTKAEVTNRERGDRGEQRSHPTPNRGRPYIARRGNGRGFVSRPTRFHLGAMPRGGWRGHPYFWGGRNYFVWGWGPYAPFWAWRPYYGWRLGLDYYVPDGLRCYADNTAVAGEWVGVEAYYSSDDAINSALDLCENDPEVVRQGMQASCRIRTCTRW